MTDADHLVSEECGEAPDADKESDWNRDVALRADIAILDQVENLEEKVAGASMQLKVRMLKIMRK